MKKKRKTIAPAATPELAHVAEAVQRYVSAERISLQEFGNRAGVPGSNKTSVARGWAYGYYAPKTIYRPRLAQLLGVEPEFFARREVALGPARRAVALKAKNEVVVAESPREPKLLRSFKEHGDGTASVELNAQRIPLDKATELFAALMRVAL